MPGSYLFATIDVHSCQARTYSRLSMSIHASSHLFATIDVHSCQARTYSRLSMSIHAGSHLFATIDVHRADPQRQSLWKRQRPRAHPFLPRGYRCGIAGGISVEEFHKQLQGALIPAHGVIGTGLKSSRVYRRRAPASTRRRAPIWSRQERTALPSRRWSDQK
jgi:hypothetical protein